MTTVGWNKHARARLCDLMPVKTFLSCMLTALLLLSEEIEGCQRQPTPSWANYCLTGFCNKRAKRECKQTAAGEAVGIFEAACTLCSWLIPLVPLQLPSQLTGGRGGREGGWVKHWHTGWCHITCNHCQWYDLGLKKKNNRPTRHLLELCLSPDAEWTMTLRKPYKPGDSSSVEGGVQLQYKN